MVGEIDPVPAIELVPNPSGGVVLRADTLAGWQIERDLSVSPDGTQLAYISDRGGSMQIWLRDVSTGRDTQLTTESTGPRYPSFAPDGRQLAYQEVGPLGTQDFTVRVLDLTTGAARKLRSSPKLWPGRMAWSADGKHLIVAELYRTGRATDGRNRLVRIDTDSDTADVLELPDQFTPDAGPVMSPTGTSLALIFDGSLWRLPVNTDGTAAAAPELVLDALVDSPAWSADGAELLVLGPEGLTRVATATGAVPCLAPWRPRHAPHSRNRVPRGYSDIRRNR